MLSLAKHVAIFIKFAPVVDKLASNILKANVRYPLSYDFKSIIVTDRNEGRCLPNYTAL